MFSNGIGRRTIYRKIEEFKSIQSLSDYSFDEDDEFKDFLFRRLMVWYRRRAGIFMPVAGETMNH
jgi:hypothetical protein